MELLVLKTETNYLRIKDNRYQLVGMSKASVYPLSQSAFVEQALKGFKKELPDLSIKKLVITEHDYSLKQ